MIIYSLFTKEDIDLINEYCGEWAEFAWRQDLDVLFRLLECIKEEEERRCLCDKWKSIKMMGER